MIGVGLSVFRESCLSITVRSPHSGVQVTVRDEDVGRALRDESGRVFYVVARSEGEGYFGSRTRLGSESDEARSAGWDAGEPLPEVAGGSGELVHDARGRRRKRPVGALVLAVVMVAALGGGVWWAWKQGWLGGDGVGVIETPAGDVVPEGSE